MHWPHSGYFIFSLIHTFGRIEWICVSNWLLETFILFCVVEIIIFPIVKLIAFFTCHSSSSFRCDERKAKWGKRNSSNSNCHRVKRLRNENDANIHKCIHINTITITYYVRIYKINTFH